MGHPRDVLGTVAALIELGANVDHTAEHGATPLFHAARCGATEVIELLLVAGGVKKNYMP